MQRRPKCGPPGIVHQHQRGGLFIVVLAVVLGLFFGLPGVVAGEVASLPWGMGFVLTYQMFQTRNALKRMVRR